MKKVSLEALAHQVTYRFVGGKPEDGILSCGFMRKPEAHQSQIDFKIPYYSCFVLLGGEGEYWDEHGVYAPLRAGSVVQRLPNRVHSTRVHANGEWLEFYVSFGKCVFDALAATDLLNRSLPVQRIHEPENQIPVFQKLLSRMGSVPDRALTPCLFEAQQIALMLTQGAGLQAGLSPLMAKACELLEKDLSREISLHEVAEQLHISYETFRKAFRREIQMSPIGYRQQKRMTTAQMMLMEGEPVKSVAKMLGYSDAYAFSKQFKRFCGCSPISYIHRFQESV